MKKILYIVDCTLNQCHSVRDILYNLITQNEMLSHEHVMVNVYRTSRLYYIKEEIKGYKTYFVPEIDKERILQNEKSVVAFGEFFIDRTLKRIPHIRHIYRSWDTIMYLEKVFKDERPDIIVFFNISPIKHFSNLCKKMNIPYISMLYDTYIERPGINQKELEIEKNEIKHSVAYFVPDFFAKTYFEYYEYKNIYSYHLPLLIPKNYVIRAYQKSKPKYKYTYFGQIQNFRNGDRIKGIFQNLGFTLDIFSTEKRDSDSVFLYHGAVSGEELYETVASSKFLIAFDNGVPYSHYLPSKAYLYVSFTKPIIVFGNNSESALLDFLKNYPFCFYFNIETTTSEELLSFINSSLPDCFNEKIYSQYGDYLPENALKRITNLVNAEIDSTEFSNIY